jgi:hypothetical protein
MTNGLGFGHVGRLSGRLRARACSRVDRERFRQSW